MKDTFITHDELLEITEQFSTPFHLYDEAGIRENVRNLHKAFSWNKGFKEYFAVKANPNPVLLSILKDEKCGFDCSSYTELMLSEALGVIGDDIMFSSNMTPIEDYKYTLKLDGIINLDDISHIDFLEDNAYIPKKISCRYNPGGNFKINNQIMDKPSDAKYGFTYDQLVDGIKLLKEKGVEEFGIHSFLASNTVANEYYPVLAKLLFETAVKIKAETGVSISFINLSGGIGIPYKPTDEKADIFVIGEGVRKAFEEVLVPNDLGNVKIFTELGRFIMGPYGCLVTTAIHRKNIYKNYIGVDSCSVDLMRPAMYRAYHHITVMGKGDVGDEIVDVCGGLCENNDKFAIDRSLPHVEIGDLIVIHDTGAHGLAMGYNYNGKLKSKEILFTEDKQAKLIRREETPADYFRTIDFLNVFDNLEDDIKVKIEV